MMPPRPPRVYLVTDPSAGGGLVAHTASALRGVPPGVVAVQLRAREATGRDLLAAARALRRVVSEAGQLLLVNDRIDVALAAGADGVHLPSAGISPGDARTLVGKGRLVAVSCHSAADVERARDGGADFATFGPVFDTPSKRRYGAPVGLDRLREASAAGLAARGAGRRGRFERTDRGPGRGVRVGRHPGMAGRRRPRRRGPGATGSDEDEKEVRDMGHGHEHGHGHGHGRTGTARSTGTATPSTSSATWASSRAPTGRPGRCPTGSSRRWRCARATSPATSVPGRDTWRSAWPRAVGPTGDVYAIDVDPRMIEVIGRRIRESGIENVHPILSRPGRAALPPRRCRVILVVNAFHHFPDGAAYLRRLAGRLAPGGRIVIVDFHRRKLPVGPPPEHKLSRATVAAEAVRAGLEVVRERRFLPYQYFLELVPVRGRLPGRAEGGSPRRVGGAKRRPLRGRGRAARGRAGRSTR